MRIHYLQHVYFEGLGSMEAEFRHRHYPITATRFYQHETLPCTDDFDVLIIMGGPMGVNDEDQYPWLKTEKIFIKHAIEQNKVVLGICLGAQLIAQILGAKVYKNHSKEIGWWPIQRRDEIHPSSLAQVFSPPCEVFHWHGDTFDLPAQSIAIAHSAACTNQGFIYQGRVIALQFHLETTLESANALITHCHDDLDASPWVQSAEQIRGNTKSFNTINARMKQLIDVLVQLV